MATLNAIFAEPAEGNAAWVQVTIEGFSSSSAGQYFGVVAERRNSGTDYLRQTLYIKSGSTYQKYEASDPNAYFFQHQTYNESYVFFVKLTYGYTEDYSFGLDRNTTTNQYEEIAIVTGTYDDYIAPNKPVNYQITYRPNGGTGQPYGQTVKSTDSSYIARDNEFGPPSSTEEFSHWNTAANDSGSIRYPGNSYPNPKANINLYAIWGTKQYTISYNKTAAIIGNLSVSNMPSSQVKFHGINLTLSSLEPTCSGYIFKGWAISENSAINGQVSYNPRSTYSSNSSITLWAVWEKDEVTYTITYHKNDGSGTVATRSHTGSSNGFSVTLSSPENLFSNPTVPGKFFDRWNTESNGDGTYYSAGASKTLYSNLNLYAIWTYNQAVTPSNLSVTKTTNSITISWKVNASYGTTYAILDSTYSSTYSITSSSTTYSYTFSGLSSNTSYTIYVYHVNGNSSKSNSIITKTNIASFVWTNNDNTYIATGQNVSNITAAKWNALQAKISEISIRNGSGDKPYNSVSSGTTMIAEGGSGQDYGFNNVRAKINGLSGSSGLPSTVNSGDEIKASYFIALKNAINNAISWTNINK